MCFSIKVSLKEKDGIGKLAELKDGERMDCLEHGGKKEYDICHFDIMTPYTNAIFSVILQSM